MCYLVYIRMVICYLFKPFCTAEVQRVRILHYFTTIAVFLWEYIMLTRQDYRDGRVDIGRAATLQQWLGHQYRRWCYL